MLEQPDDKARSNWGKIWLLTLPLLLLLGAGAYFYVKPSADCVAPEQTATVWNEALLDAIRRDFPAPTVHSRNLYHTSAAMWDSWAAYEPEATGVFTELSLESSDTQQDRSETMSYAAHKILTTRYEDSVGSEESLAQFEETLTSFCFSSDEPITEDSAASAGIKIADAILEAAKSDGSLEDQDYVDNSYAPINQPLIVAASGAEMVDLNRWQPLALEEQFTQNGQSVPSDIQTFIGSNWGDVTPFALGEKRANGLRIDPGPPPLWQASQEKFATDAALVVDFASRLDPASKSTIDISPATQGNVKLGTYKPTGRDTNPASGDPYESNVVLEADYGRVIAEFWADGPDSETPPGHWNTLAIEVANQLEQDQSLELDGQEVNRMEWDVKVGLALNGALHDAAIAAWGTKAHYDYARPISMIRFLGAQGDLAETPGLVETITAESAGDGARHSELSDYVGEQAVYSWLGQPEEATENAAGVGWMRAADWVPYQRETFVTPAFAGYVSGHSVFSRAAAEVLTEMTGSEYFPGGLQTHTIEPGELIHEYGPSEAITLKWATYQDASDQAGLSRLYGGIHVPADDLEGRKIGAEVGQMAINRARSYFD